MMDGWMRLELEGVEISAGGWRQRCETEIASAGGYVVAVTTVVPDRNVTLASSYLSSLAGATAACHMRLGAGEVTFDHRVVELAGVTHARGYLLDHAAELRGLVARLLSSQNVRVEILDEALSRAERVWQQCGD
jgi:hypothetical protein